MRYKRSKERAELFVSALVRDNPFLLDKFKNNEPHEIEITIEDFKEMFLKVMISNIEEELTANETLLEHALKINHPERQRFTLMEVIEAWRKIGGKFI